MTHTNFTHSYVSYDTFKPYAIFEREGGQVEKFIFRNRWGASVASHSGSMAGTKDFTNLQKSIPQDTLLMSQLKDG